MPSGQNDWSSQPAKKTNSPLSTGLATRPLGIPCVPETRHVFFVSPWWLSPLSQHCGFVQRSHPGTAYAHAAHSFVALHFAQHNFGSAVGSSTGMFGRSPP